MSDGLRPNGLRESYTSTETAEDCRMGLILDTNSYAFSRLNRLPERARLFLSLLFPRMRHKMLWIAIMVMCCLQTVESEECDKTEIIVGQLGKELVLNFPLSDLRDEYNKYIIEHDSVKKFKDNETTIQDLKNDSNIRFRNKMNSKNEDIIFIHGKSNNLIRSGTEITMTDDAFMVKKTKLQKEDAGIYWINFNVIHLGQKALIIAGKPTIEGRSPPNPVLKPEDNYTSILQLECHSVSTSIGDCQPVNNPMYIMWYKNGMRMTELDPTLSQINVTVDHNGGNITCLATEYLPCYERLQNTTDYDVLNIEECNNVSESETFYYKPQHAPINVELEPDQREITVKKYEDLKVKCSAKCHPKCNVTWEKDFQDLESNSSFFITENWFGKDLKIVNINSSHEGVYVCLVNNTHGENKKNFTLSVTVNPTTVNPTTVNPTTVNPTINIKANSEPENKEVKSAEKNNVIVAVTVIIVIIVAVIVIVIIVIIYKKYQIIIYKKYQIVIMVIMYKKYQKKKNDYRNTVREGSSSEEDEGIFETMDLYQGAPLTRTSRSSNSRNGVDNNMPESVQYAMLELNAPNGYRIHGIKREHEVLYSTIDFTKKAPPMPKSMEVDSDDEDWS
ncbi:hypothetical protein LOTGIDRAFT_165140 [Lottia gigantea]|uniref:Ig-like domain-containing protein n=1 Tax=Lottia gigantea TaxID=225164 RepID=V3ZEI1_LOTGI|nr:hypothetical protein LOTGIDRAFT_165140 [Lottia gigantea]ESO89548.1 hypothetical protein LOTGIDRAFT_165140 [Lottia gigantea]